MIRGLHRGSWVSACPGPVGDLGADRAGRTTASPRTGLELAREYRATLENIVESRGMPQVAEFLRGIYGPGQIADMAGYSPDLSFERKVEVLETIDVEARLEMVLAWAKDTLAEIEVKETHPRRGVARTSRSASAS